jgi:hypothetical protein
LVGDSESFVFDRTQNRYYGRGQLFELTAVKPIRSVSNHADAKSQRGARWTAICVRDALFGDVHLGSSMATGNVTIILREAPAARVGTGFIQLAVVMIDGDSQHI